MKSKFITDPQDPSDGFGFLDTAGAEFSLNFTSRGSSFSPPAPQDVGSPPSGDPVEIPSTALVSEAVQASGAQSGATTTLALTSGGITINLLFDAAAMAAPASFRAGIQQAASLLTAAISDEITVNIKIDYSGTGGGAAAGPDNGQYVTYSTVRSDLVNNATLGDPVFNALPTGSTFQTQSNVAVWNAQLKLWGILAANDTTTDDGSATFATDINPNLLVGVALHELTHAMGRVPYGPPYGSQPDIFDFFRFTAPNNRLINGASTATAAYFSVDGGNTKLSDYGQTSDPSDFLNSGIQGSNDPFNEFYSGSTIQSLSAVDKEQLDALGFHTSVTLTPIVIEAFGLTSLTKVGTNYFLDNISTGTGPELKNGGVAVVAGQYGTWTPIGVEQTASGYDVAWKDPSSGQYTVWGTDNNGNFASSIIPVAVASDATLESIETTFHQDLNGDGVIGLPPLPTTVIEAFGLTNLTKVGTNYFLDNISTGTGPELKNGGVAVVAGQYGTWTPIGVEQTASGYDVAWKDPSSGQYTVWGTDNNGNFASSIIPVAVASDATLESIETTFHQDLNGDGVIGLPPLPTTVIEAFGLTNLTKVGTNYFLDNISTGTGPELKNGGVAVVAGQYGTWTPIGVEQTASGYDVAWKDPSSGQYTVWGTDNNGNFASSIIPVAVASDATLESIETTFHQDLNGDGVIGLPPLPTTVIEAFGLTNLTKVGTNYFLDNISTGTGPELKNGGVAVVAGQYGTWTPIGVEQTASGYDVAWKDPSSGQYTVWGTDNNGNFASSIIPVAVASDATLESIETTFHQDLNGDGVIGLPPLPTTVIEAFGLTNLTKVGTNYFLDNISTGTGPELKNGGVAVVAGQYGTWTPIGVEQTASGYDVAWKDPSSGQYTVWGTDNNGNFASSIMPVAVASDATLESIETTFHQDLNGDGVIGVPARTSFPISQSANAHSGSVVLDGTTLTLDAPSVFSGQIIGFTGNGTLAGSDQIDLHNVSYNSLHASFDASIGLLAVGDSSTTANLQFLGHYSQDNFQFADDGNGGTLIYGASTSAEGGNTANQIAVNSQTSTPITAAHDTFVFAPNFGQVNITNFIPATDSIQFSKAVFASVNTMLAATHDDANGDAVITDAAHDMITIQHVTTAQLLAHQSDFHFV